MSEHHEPGRDNFDAEKGRPHHVGSSCAAKFDSPRVGVQRRLHGSDVSLGVRCSELNATEEEFGSHRRDATSAPVGQLE